MPGNIFIGHLSFPLTELTFKLRSVKLWRPQVLLTTYERETKRNGKKSTLIHTDFIQVTELFTNISASFPRMNNKILFC